MQLGQKDLSMEGYMAAETADHSVHEGYQTLNIFDRMSDSTPSTAQTSVDQILHDDGLDLQDFFQSTLGHSLSKGTTQSAKQVNDQSVISGGPQHVQHFSIGTGDTNGFHLKSERPAALHFVPQLSTPDVSISSTTASPSIEGGKPQIRPTPVRSKFSTTEDLRPRSSMPSRLSSQEHARQGILAAYSSRLNPYALHVKEFDLLKRHINKSQVTVYLNIRNAILRLWHRNPLVSVTRQEAAGCAREHRHVALALIAHEWLLRHGYINFGCVDAPLLSTEPAAAPRGKISRQKIIVVIGAGMSGLGCARHLTQVFEHYAAEFARRREQPPRIIVLEGRKRIGGRVYSHPLSKQGRLPGNLKSTAELGGQIVVGFDHGNPLSCIIRGQLAIPYHEFRDINSPLYDCDGRLVDKAKDVQVEKLWNDILERASAFRHNAGNSPSVFGSKEHIIIGEDGKDDDGATLALLEESGIGVTTSNDADTTQNVNFGLEKVAGRQYQSQKSADQPAAQAARDMGWLLRPHVQPDQSISIGGGDPTHASGSLGVTLDNGIRQFQELITLTPQDIRLLNWHHANLEYANAANVDDLSLTGWDQDIGNEFEGYHSVIVGGYSQVPRGLMLLPEPIDVRLDSGVQSVKYNNAAPSSNKPAIGITCIDGTSFDADEVVLTVPLGVLKQGSIIFQPPLPDWKRDAISRMGFGLLNKIVLVYKQCFWDEAKDMFGFLNSPGDEVDDQSQYGRCRGRFYLVWNCMKTSGQPVLIALMAGAAAVEAETADDQVLVEEITARLARTFAPKKVPLPTEYIVTKWRQDPFARGTYSYVGTNTAPGDYDVMAQPVGPIHFAGEATCGTHPATIHGAYLSGLRAASEVIESILGPIIIEQQPLIPAKSKGIAPAAPMPKRKHGYVHIWEPINKPDPFYASMKLDDEREAYEARIMVATVEALGPRPVRPLKQKVNPYSLYTKDEWANCKALLDAQAVSTTGDPGATASKIDVRNKLGTDWRTASDAIKQPYIERCQNSKHTMAEALKIYTDASKLWDTKAAEFRQTYRQEHPPPEYFEQGRKSRKPNIS